MVSKFPKKTTGKPILSAKDCMPTQKDIEDILRARAKNLAENRPDREAKKNKINYIRFRLGNNEYYGIPYSMTKEIIHHTIPTKVPFTPEYICGVINCRGTLLPVFDFKKLFHIQALGTANMHIILITSHQITVGVLVDNIEGNDSYEPSELDPMIASDSINPNYILGLHNGITAIINVNAILADAKEV